MSSEENSKCACSCSSAAPRYATGSIETPAGNIPVVSPDLTSADLAGKIRVRLAIGRNSYTVKPALYACGNPTPESPVFVTANYKLSFDALRRELKSIDSWILALDTKGINVWCAAGKGTFGTQELINRIEQTELKEVISHNRIILPQLGAPGVAAHEVTKATGLRVTYGPVRASDIPRFIESSLEADDEMRRVRFTMRDRLAVIPVELVIWARHALILVLAMILLATIQAGGFNVTEALKTAPTIALVILLAYLSGGSLTPLLLPWLPGRAFALKGMWAGLITSAVIFNLIEYTSGKFIAIAAWGCIITTISSFMAMNFTGTSTFTSLSGVKKEMSVAIPCQILALLVGIGLWIYLNVTG